MTSSREQRDGRSLGARFGPFLGVAFAIAALDQWTKAIVRETIQAPIVVIDGLLNLVHVRNPGAAFSLFAAAPGWFREPFFLIVGVSAIGLLAYLNAQLERSERWLQLVYGGVLGGAIGNLIDRIRFGEVTDFVDLHWRGYHWPAFNVADSSITIAVVLVIVHWVVSPKETASP